MPAAPSWRRPSSAWRRPLCMRRAAGLGGWRAFSWLVGAKKDIDDAAAALGVRTVVRSNAEQALDALVADQHAEQELGGELRVVAPQLPGAHRALEVRAELAGHLAGARRVHVLCQRAEARHLRHHRAERGDAFRAQHALAVSHREAHQARAQVLGRGLELYHHPPNQVVRHLLEERVLAREEGVNGLLRNAAAAGDAVEARALA